MIEDFKKKQETKTKKTEYTYVSVNVWLILHVDFRKFFANF